MPRTPWRRSMTSTSERGAHSRRSSPTRHGRCSMPSEDTLPRHLRLESSVASAPLQGMHEFASSGALGGTAATGSRSSSLGAGASALSFERATKTAAVVIAFGTTMTFAPNPSFAAWLTPDAFEVRGAQKSAQPFAGTDEREAEARSLGTIMSALDEDPIEDGVAHLAERALDTHIERFGSTPMPGAVSASVSPARAAALLRLLGRSTKIGVSERMVL